MKARVNANALHSFRVICKSLFQSPFSLNVRTVVHKAKRKSEKIKCFNITNASKNYFIPTNWKNASMLFKGFFSLQCDRFKFMLSQTLSPKAFENEFANFLQLHFYKEASFWNMCARFCYGKCLHIEPCGQFCSKFPAAMFLSTKPRTFQESATKDKIFLKSLLIFFFL